MFINQGPLHLLAQGFVNQKQAQTDTGDIEKVGWGARSWWTLPFRGLTKTDPRGPCFHMVGDQRIAAFLTQGSTTDGAALGGDYSVDTVK